MPQASDELRKSMQKRFGTFDDGPPSKFLEERGYTRTPQHLWKPKPGINTLGQMPREEFDCLLFLVHEWDEYIVTGDEGFRDAKS